MNPLVRPVLEALRSTVRHLRRFKASDVATQVLLAEVEQKVAKLFGDRTDTIHFALTSDGLWFGDDLLLHETLEFADLGRQVRARGIESISIDRDHSRFATLAFTQFVAGTSSEVPVDEGIRVNAVPLPQPIDPGSRGPGLRRAYLLATEALRDAVFAARAGEGVDMERIKWVADRLVVASGGRPIGTALLATLQNPTEYLFHHSVNTALLAIEMGRAAGLRVGDLRVVAIGSLLHDLGKAILVPEAIENPGPLDASQWARLRNYPMASAAAILEAGVRGTEVAAVIALEHNQRHDGHGHHLLPDGRDIHPAAALVGVVDVYEVVTARRPYRRAETNGNALKIIEVGSGTQFDPAMARLFIDRFGPIPPGSCFRLRSGEILLAVGATRAGARGLIVEDAKGHLLPVPHPVDVPRAEMASELSVLETSVRPAAYLDHVETLERRTTGRPGGGR